jgi:acyl-CoA synthetase (NDP forming)
MPAGLAETQAVADAVATGVARARAAGAAGKPVLACLMAGQEVQTRLDLGGERIPCYAFPEAAARVLAKAAAYADWRARPPGVIPDFTDLDLPAAREVCRNALARRGAGWLSAVETRAVLGSVRLPLPPGGFAATAEEAVDLAGRVGFPVAVKLASCQLVHKTEAGGVYLKLSDAAAVRGAFEDMRAHLGREGRLDAMDGVVVQPMLGGVEVMVGVTQDPLFGPLVAFGLGGVHVEVLADVCFRVAPLTDRDAAEMVRGIRGFPLLQGHRGSAPADLGAIEEVLLRVSRLAEEVPEIGEVDLNPVFALPPGQGCQVADARVLVRTPS